MFLQIIVSTLCLLILDSIWIGFLAKAAYFKAYGNILRLVDGKIDPVWWAVLVVYVVLVFGVNYYALSYKSEPIKAISEGAIFGLVVYAVYDFTCLSLFKNWPIYMSLIDCLWGGILCSVTVGVTILCLRLI